MTHHPIIRTLILSLCLLLVPSLPNRAAATAQPAITFVAATTAFRQNNDRGGISTPHATKPGDFLLLFIARNSSAITRGLHGWTAQRGGTQSDTLHLLHRRATRAGAITYRFDFSTIGNARYVLAVFRGVATGSPVHQADYGAAIIGTTAAFPRPVTTLNGCVIVRASYATNQTAQDARLAHSCGQIIGGFPTAGHRLLVSLESQPIAGQVPACSVSSDALLFAQANTLVLAPARPSRRPRGRPSATDFGGQNRQQEQNRLYVTPCK